MKKIKQEELETRRVRFKDDEGNTIGCFTTVSIVTDPAIELDFMLFSKPEVKSFEFVVTNTELMEITGPALVPDTLILRKDKKNNKFYNAIFSKEDVKDARDIYFRSANHNQVNFEHNQKDFTNKIGLVESWIVVDKEKDKANALGFDMSKIPLGTLFMTYKVLDKELWEDLKESDFKGFSVEIGAFEEIVEEDEMNFSDIESILDSAPLVNVKSKYTLLYNLIKDIVFDETMSEEVKQKLLRKLLKKI